jgi:hypothetical protein
MKKLLFLGIISLFAFSANAQSVAINTDGSTADASAILDLKSTNQGVLVPRLTQSQRTMISAPATGLMVYQTDATAGFYFYNGTAWTSMNGTAGTNGTNGQGLLTGGTANQVLAKIDGTNYNTAWVTPATGGSDNLGNHTATTTLNMSNNNITNVKAIKTKELIVGITTLWTDAVDITSSVLDATVMSNTYINLYNYAGGGTTLHGMAGGVHGKIVYLGVLANTTFANHSDIEPNSANRFEQSFVGEIPANIVTGQQLFTCIYDATIDTGRWVIIGYQQ